jgi:hypothetical protein
MNRRLDGGSYDSAISHSAGADAEAPSWTAPEEGGSR